MLAHADPELAEEQIASIVAGIRTGWSNADLPLLDEARELVDGLSETICGHIIVDEAQLLSEMEWRMLMRRNPNRSMTIVGDLAQAGPPDWCGGRVSDLGNELEDAGCCILQFREVTVRAAQRGRAVHAPDGHSCGQAGGDSGGRVLDDEAPSGADPQLGCRREVRLRVGLPKRRGFRVHDHSRNRQLQPSEAALDTPAEVGGYKRPAADLKLSQQPFCPRECPILPLKNIVILESLELFERNRAVPIREEAGNRLCGTRS